jgi:hypothetical protein
MRLSSGRFTHFFWGAQLDEPHALADLLHGFFDAGSGVQVPLQHWPSTNRAQGRNSQVSLPLKSTTRCRAASKAIA